MKIKDKIRDNRAATLTDVIIGVVVLIIFTGIFTTWIYNIYKHNYLAKYDAIATYYMVKIAEEIDLLPYEEVDNELNESITDLVDLPDEYNVNITVSDYLTGNIIKIVTINLEYESLDDTVEFDLKKLKIKEL